MKAAIAVLVLVISFSAHSAKESSAIDQLRAIPSERFKCEKTGEDYAQVQQKKQPIPKEKLEKALQTFKGTYPATPNDVEVGKAAMKEDPAAAITFYINQVNCRMLRRHLSTGLIEFAKNKAVTDTEKDEVKNALREGLTAPKHPTFIEAMIDAAILQEAFDSKIFAVGSGTSESKKLQEIKSRLRADAKKYSDEMSAKFGDLVAETSSDSKVIEAKIRNNPNYEKHKGVFAKEIESADRGLSEIRALAAQLK